MRRPLALVAATALACSPLAAAAVQSLQVTSPAFASGAAIPLPPHRAVLLASADVSDGHLPPDATVWLRPDPAAAEPAGRVPHDD